MAPLIYPPLPQVQLQVSRDYHGVEASLQYVGIELRLNTRGRLMQVRTTADPQWQTMKDEIDAKIKQRIYDCCQMAIPVQGGGTRLVQASFKSVVWQESLLGLVEGIQVDPFMEYLLGLPAWDGVQRVEKLFIDGLKAVDTPLNRYAGQGFMVAGVKRTFEPGVRYDVMPVLAGGQGGGKSTFADELCDVVPGEMFFVDNLDLQAKSKELSENCGGAVFVEFSEMAGADRTMVGKLKAVLSARTDTYRAAYARYAAPVPRCWVPIGTANDDGNGVLPRDTTGHRRFIVVEVGTVEGDQPMVVNYVRTNRDQLWAEALLKYQQGASPYIPGNLWADRDAINSRYEMASPRIDSTLQDYEARWSPDAHDGPLGFRLKDILEDAGVSGNDIPMQRKVISELRSRGWDKKRVMADNKKITRWFPAEYFQQSDSSDDAEQSDDYAEQQPFF